MAWKATWRKTNPWWRSLLNLRLVVYILCFSICFINTEHTSPLCLESARQDFLKNFSAIDTCRRSEANRSYRLFCEVMSQYDCRKTYSVKWNCTHCLEAYIIWALAVFKENHTTVVSLCNDVQAKCPYIAPKIGYGDIPAFNCPQSKEAYNWTCPKNQTNNAES